MVPGAGAVSEAARFAELPDRQRQGEPLEGGERLQQVDGDHVVDFDVRAGTRGLAAAALSQAITTRAWWSSNWWRSSREVYSGLCSTTTAPRRSTA